MIFAVVLVYGCGTSSNFSRCDCWSVCAVYLVCSCAWWCMCSVFSLYLPSSGCLSMQPVYGCGTYLIFRVVIAGLCVLSFLFAVVHGGVCVLCVSLYFTL